MWIFLIISTLCWGIGEIFYKKGNIYNEKYSHLKTTIFVGLFMGIYALITFLLQDREFIINFPINFIKYLPVSLCYIFSMVFSYFGVRFIEESISDPIENTSIAFVPILCAIFLKETFSLPVIIGIMIVFLGLILISLFDKKGINDRKNQFGKKLAIIAICMPFCYMLLDSVGTFLDIFYCDASKTILVGINEENIEHACNCAYEFTFFIFAILLFIFLKIKKVKIFSYDKDEKEDDVKWYKKIFRQKYKILAAIFETIGQATYIFALSSGKGIAAVILGAGTVLVSLLLSRIFLKEKLSLIQYGFVFLILAGIITISIFSS